MIATMPLDERALARFVAEVDERWPLVGARLGGARVLDARGAGPQRERGEEYVVVLVSEAFADRPWLERVHGVSALWDRDALGARAEVHCYTPAEHERRLEALPAVRDVAERGVDLRAPLAPQLTPLAVAAVADDEPYTGV